MTSRNLLMAWGLALGTGLGAMAVLMGAPVPGSAAAPADEKAKDAKKDAAKTESKSETKAEAKKDEAKADEKEGEAKPEAKAEPKPLVTSPVRTAEVPDPVVYAVAGDYGSVIKFERAKTEEGADVYVVTYSKYLRTWRAIIAADGNIVSKDDISPMGSVPTAPQRPKPVEPTPPVMEIAKVDPKPDPKTKTPVPVKPGTPTPKPDPKTKPVVPPVVVKPAPKLAAVSYSRQVQPILQRACYNCHGMGRSKGGVSLEGPQLAAVLSPGQPDGSLLYQSVSGTGGARRMPPGRPLAAAEIELIKAWIAGGCRLD